jgi:hypothetical protein
LILGDRWSKGVILQGTTPTIPPFLPPPTGAIPSQQQYAKGILSATAQGQQMAGWTVRFSQKEEGQVVPAVSLGGDLAVTPEGQRLRGRLLPNRDPEPGEPLLVTGSPGNYLLDTLSWDPAGSSAYSPSAYSPSAYSPSVYSLSAYSPVVLDSRRRCGLCATVDDFYTEDFESQRRGILPGWYTATSGSRVYLARRMPEGVQSVKVGPEQGVGRDHALFISVYSFEECVRQDRQVGFWARGRFAVPFPEPFHAVVLVKIRLDEGENGNWLFSPGWFQSNTVAISIAADGSWQATWQDNPRQPSEGTVQPDSVPSTRTGVFSVFFQFPLEADLATLVDLEMCFGNAGLRRIANG